MARLGLQDECLLRELVRLCGAQSAIAVEKLGAAVGVQIERLRRILAVLQERGLVLLQSDGVVTPSASGRDLVWNLDHWRLEA